MKNRKIFYFLVQIVTVFHNNTPNIGIFFYKWHDKICLQNKKVV
ncbi:hypothetical protein NEISICOT_03479 [Neisseria sicca ATCC 29256]|uniref:Uncharacterized protein n=1 Tax=Neisseria sicca ATCC 29256 TaxID=547045 RepID=C6MA97_NEISI|nr:hypothetical protein NEISICOT_03479 [Neisseria sicca ATCC 29256]